MLSEDSSYLNFMNTLKRMRLPNVLGKMNEDSAAIKEIDL